MASPDTTETLLDPAQHQQGPKITRKITACVACRKQKIKCHMDDGPPCTRCRKRKLPCSVNKSLQTILQNDVLWKQAIEEKIQQLEDRLSASGSGGEANADDNAQRMSLIRSTAEQLNGGTATNNSQPAVPTPASSHDAWEVVMDTAAPPGAIPGSVFPSTGTQETGMKPDIISRGVIAAAKAQDFLDLYHNRLDHFVYRILGDNKTLKDIRQSSSLLLAAISAVGALHSASPDFEKLYAEFVAVASTQSFSRRLNTDDVRGLCIGAFWLSGISWACVAAAVRISTEIQLQRSIHKAIEGGPDDRAHYLRTRLYYLVFVCDHQFSIPYGRPPMTPSCTAIKANAQFLDSRRAVEDDFRLVSQVRLWEVFTKVYLTLGGDVDQPLTAAMLDPIRRFAVEIDTIRSEWTERFSRNQFVGNYPRKGVGMHSHFAKLYLCSHAFRGLGHAKFRPPEIALEIDELANAALLSATSILQTVVGDKEIQQFLNGLPTYFDLLLAFSVVFLLKVSTSYTEFLQVDVFKIRSLVAELVVVLKEITSTMHGRHILVSVARGSEILLQKCDAAAMATTQQQSMSLPAIDQQYFDQSFYDVPVNWSDLYSLDNFYMGDFNFLSNQNAFGGS